MVDSREKGARCERAVRDKLRDYTDLQWQRVPGSGALGAEHLLKGDLYIPGEYNHYCVEVKHYKDSAINHLLIGGKGDPLFDWWKQAVRQGIQVKKRPLLIFKHDRSKLFLGTEDKPLVVERYIFLNEINLYVMMLDDWILKESVSFIKE